MVCEQQLGNDGKKFGGEVGDFVSRSAVAAWAGTSLPQTPANDCDISMHTIPKFHNLRALDIGFPSSKKPTRRLTTWRLTEC
jgi:hypothetical protein